MAVACGECRKSIGELVDWGWRKGQNCIDLICPHCKVNSKVPIEDLDLQTQVTVWGHIRATEQDIELKRNGDNEYD